MTTKESLFDKKVGKVTFSARKSLPCRYSALSLHSETGWKWPLSDLFSSSCLRHAFVVPSSCLRFRRRRKDGGKYEVRAKNYEVSGGCQSSIPNFKNKSSLTCLLLGCHRTALRLYGVIKIQHLRCC